MENIIKLETLKEILTIVKAIREEQREQRVLLTKKVAAKVEQK